MNSCCFCGGDNLLWVKLSEPADIFSNGAIEQLDVLWQITDMGS